MSQVSKQLDYKRETFIHPSYRLNKILPLSGQTTQTVSPNGGTETVFELPVAALNLAQSFVTFQFRIPAAPNPGYNNVHKDCFPHWSQIQLYTRAGTYLCNLNELPNYTKITWNAETCLKDFLDLDFMRGVPGGTNGPPPTFPGATANPGAIGAGLHFHRSGVIKNDYTGNAARPAIAGNFTNSGTVTFPTGAAMTVATTIHIPLRPTDATVVNGLTVVNTASPAASDLDYTEPSYVYRSALEAGGAQSALTMNVYLPLKYIKNTIFSLDKDIYFGEIILMRVVWAPSTRLVFANTSATDLSAATGGAIPTVNTIGIRNLALYLAVEKNPEVTNSLRERIASGGLNILFPFVHYEKNSRTGTNQNVSLRYNRAHGLRLLKIYHSIFNSVEDRETAYDNNNINGAKCVYYYTMLNNERQQEYNVESAQLDDYNLHRKFLKDKVLQTANMYQYNWFHLDSYTGDIDNAENKDSLETGLDLSIEQKWDIFCNTTNFQYYHYSFAVVQKMLTITPAGIRAE